MNFKHGGDIYQFALKHGYRVEEVIDLSSNINFIKPKIDIDFNKIDISSYPNYITLLDSIAKNYSLKTNQIELFNGATVAIYSLLSYLNIKEINLYAPIYLEYKRYSLLNGYKINYINRFENLYQNLKPNSIAIFVNPSTPDGKYYDIDRLMEKWIKSNITVIIDESFLDFTDFKSVIEYIDRYDKLYIIKSMTKFYASAGIRIGFIASNSKNILKIKQNEPLWKISQFDSLYIQSALKDKEFIAYSKKINQINKNKLIKILENSNFIEKIFPSCVNFVLVKLKNIDAKTFQEKLNHYKIMIRDCSNFDFLNDNFVRIAIKNNKSIKKLKDALCEIST